MSTKGAPLNVAVLISSNSGTSAESENRPAPGNLEPKVVKVYGELAPGGTITVFVTNLFAWSNLSPENDPTKLLPLINGRQLLGLYPIETYLRTGVLRFRLLITAANKDAWTDLLRRPTSLKRDATVTVGPEGKERFDSIYRYNSKLLKLTIMSGWWAFVSLTLVAVTGIVLVQLCRKTELVRDAPICSLPRQQHRPYNLGRTQMAFWFFLILTSYVVLWLVTRSLETITTSILALMGISAGTALGDTLIDANKHESENAQRRSLLAEKKKIEIKLVDPQHPGITLEASTPPQASSAQALSETPNKDRVELQNRLEELDKLLTSLEPSENEKVSQGFFRDLLTDGHGFSFHRFQIVAWTLVLGTIFVASVYESLQMPEFSSTLLGLMGISAGTYVSLKFPEK